MKFKKQLSFVLAALCTCTMPLPVHAQEPTYPTDSDDYKAMLSEYPEYYRIQGDSVYFLEHSLMGETDFVISSESRSSVEYADYGYVFTPEEDGRYVIVLEETIQECVGNEELTAMILYKNKHAYIAEVENGEISVSYEGSSDGKTSFDDTPCAEDRDYYSYVNGELPEHFDRYITTVYGYQSVQSYFCLNSGYTDGLLGTDVTTSDNTVAYCGMQMGVSSELTTDDVQALSIVRAVSDGEAVITVNDEWQFDVKVENGIFTRAEEMTVLPPNLDAPTLSGDCNADSKFTVADAVMLQKYLLCTGNLTAPQNADLTGDGAVDGFDLAVMKKMLIEKNAEQTPENMPVIMDYYDAVTDADRETLWTMLSGKFPDMDFSDFTFVYDPDHPLSDYYNGKLFSIYYKNILLHGYGNINCDASVFAVVGDTNAVNFVVDPKLFTQVDLEQEILSPLDVIPTCIDVETPELILYVDVMGENPPRLAYRAVDVGHDGEYILDAVTGESIEYIPYYVI